MESEISDKLLAEYKKFLLDLFQSNSEDFFTNGGKEHASILLSVMYDNAQSEAKVFCEGLNPDIFVENSDLYNSFMNYIEKDKEIKILMESDKNLSILPASKIISKSNVEIRIINDEDKKIIFESLHTDRCNFSIFDGKMVRLETEPDNYKAIGSFNRPDWADSLTKLFNSAFDNARKIN